LITEQEMSEIQRAIAICNNINVAGEDDSEAMKIVKVNDQEIMKYKYKYDTINQWRILFYFIRFYVKNKIFLLIIYK
jgi:UDP-N-acetylglucosamine enolpyruvyl transferase